MRIGIVPDLRRAAGGIYQYSMTMTNALREWSARGSSDNFVLLTNGVEDPALQLFSKPRWEVRAYQPASVRRTAKNILSGLGLDGATRRLLAKIRKGPTNFDVDRVRSRTQDRQWLRSLGIELMLYPAPQTHAFETGLPYIMAIHDLQHRLQPEFPEVSADGEWEFREYLFRNGSRNALFLLADSETGKEDILNFYGPYGVEPERVKVLPFLPASYLPSGVTDEERLRIRRKYNLPEQFLFYPAQFWPHKNHIRIVRALGILKQRKIFPPIVFCGSSAGELRTHTLKEAMQAAEDNNVTGQILNLGYVPDEDMGGLYSEAKALVMPTFFGPTNIPILEAWRFGCPVVTSDIRGVREQVGQGAVLVDPRSEESIADGIFQVWTDWACCKNIVSTGRAILESYTPADFRNRLIDVIQQAKVYGTD
jgi:glycosyltransferase involved in cell wall biosynthesis